jgi:hypothetical protein
VYLLVVAAADESENANADGQPSKTA